MVNHRCCATLYCRIAPERIHFLKFILEGYDGLAVLSTHDRQKGIVTIRYPYEAQPMLLGLLEQLAPSLIAQKLT